MIGNFTINDNVNYSNNGFTSLGSEVIIKKWSQSPVSSIFQTYNSKKRYLTRLGHVFFAEIEIDKLTEAKVKELMGLTGVIDFKFDDTADNLLCNLSVSAFKKFSQNYFDSVKLVIRSVEPYFTSGRETHIVSPRVAKLDNEIRLRACNDNGVLKNRKYGR